MASPRKPLAVATTQNIGTLITSLQIKITNVRIQKMLLVYGGKLVLQKQS